MSVKDDGDDPLVYIVLSLTVPEEGKRWSDSTGRTTIGI